MPSLRTNKRLVASYLAVLFAATSLTAASAQANGTSQRIVLIDPTPRERDPHAIFGNDPADHVRQQQAAALQRAQRRDLVVAETDQLLLLAQQLRDSIVSHSASGPTVPDVMTAQKIEKLAKSVKDNVKTQ